MKKGEPKRGRVEGGRVEEEEEKRWRQMLMRGNLKVAREDS